MLWQPPLPDRYASLTPERLADAIAARKQQLGHGLVILGHHYQQDDVVRHADFTGDSFKLSQLAAQKVREVGSRHVIFCGVHFMAESADVLTPENVSVTLPDLSAGCSMADMAALEDVTDAWEQIHDITRDAGQNTRIVPITYMNSTAAIKAFVGEHGGAVCTSSNAAAIMKWAFAGGATPLEPGEQVKVMFFPDQHLGRNTAAVLGYDVSTQTTMWDPRDPMPLGGTTEEAILRSAVILWKGHCSVHKLFRPEHADELRAKDPRMKIIVHPECEHGVVLKADVVGSTEKIIKTIEAAEPGSRWAIGTEVHLVHRLAQQAAKRDVYVRILSDCQCLCTTMYRIDPQHLLWTLDELAEGRVVNPIKVDPQTREGALLALERMLEITAAVPA